MVGRNRVISGRKGLGIAIQWGAKASEKTKTGARLCGGVYKHCQYFFSQSQKERRQKSRRSKGSEQRERHSRNHLVPHRLETHIYANWNDQNPSENKKQEKCLLGGHQS